jgi:hypothetical protein
MPLSDAIRGFDLNTKINPNNSRGAFQLGKEVNNSLDVFYDAVWDGNKLEFQSLSKLEMRKNQELYYGIVFLT